MHRLLCRHFCLMLPLGLLIGLATSCKQAAGPDLLKGKWKVVYVRNGTEEFGGPTFNGTDFTFRDNGTVLATQYSGDTAVSNYTRRGDSLIYLNPTGNEAYAIDTLTQEKLVITAVMNGMRKHVRMVRLKD
jgi:hypothetical protein